MRKVMVLGGGSDQCSLIQELRKRSIETIILVDYYENPPAKSLVDKHYVISTLDQEAVLRIAQNEKAELVTTACIDQAVLTMAYVSEQLNLPCPIRYAYALQATNKYYMKSRFVAQHIPTAKFKLIENLADVDHHELSYPLVVKPADSNGSFGIRKVHSSSELSQAVLEALKISRSKKAIVEEYIEGIELSVDTFIVQGRAYILLVTETRKNPLLKNSFAICQSLYPAELKPELLTQLQDVVHRIALAFDLDNTPLLIQMVTDGVNLHVLEFGARIAGGSKHHLIKYVTSFDVMRAYVDTLFSLPVLIETVSCNKHVSMNYIYAYPGVFSSVSGAEELLAERTMQGLYLYKTSGMHILNSQASRDRVGSFLVEGNTSVGMMQNLQRIERNLRILDPHGRDIMIHGLYL